MPRGRSSGRSGGGGGRSMGRSGGGGGRSRSVSRGRSMGGGGRSMSRGRSVSRTRGSVGGRRWVGRRSYAPRSYTRYYNSGRPYTWRPRYYRNYSSYYYLPSYYNAYGGYSYPYYSYATSPYWNYYRYTPYTYLPDYYVYGSAESQQEQQQQQIVNAVQVSTDPNIDPATWVQSANRVIHQGSGTTTPPTYLFCRNGRPTAVDASAGTAEQPLINIDNTYYQCR